MFASNATVTVRQVIDAYLVDADLRHRAGEFSRSSLTASRRDLARFAKQFGDTLLSACRNSDLTQFIFSPSWKANATRRRVLAEVLACFRWGQDALGVPCPYHRPKSLRLPVQPRREATASEYVALMRRGKRCLRQALFFLRRVGCRPGEMRAATWADLHWAEHVVVLSEHKTRRAMGGLPRVFGLDQVVMRFLANLYRRAADGTGPIFRNTRGQPWTADAFSHHLRSTLRRIGLDLGAGKRVVAYCFRHSWTTRAIEHGASDRAVADQLGHSTTSLIPWYSHAKGKYAYLRQVAETAMGR